MRNINCDVVYSPTILHEMGLKILYTLVGATPISLLIQFYKIDTDLDMLLHPSIDCLVIELGVPGHPFTYTHEKYQAVAKFMDNTYLDFFAMSAS